MKTLQSVAQLNRIKGVTSAGFTQLTPVQFQQQRFQNQEVLKQEKLNNKMAVEGEQFTALKQSLGMLDSDITERAMQGVENIIMNVPELSQLRTKIDVNTLSGEQQKQFIEATRKDFDKAGEPGEIAKQEAIENLRLRANRMLPGLRELPPKRPRQIAQTTPWASAPKPGNTQSDSALLNIIKR